MTVLLEENYWETIFLANNSPLTLMNNEHGDEDCVRDVVDARQCREIIVVGQKNIYFKSCRTKKADSKIC